jgi:hypothetical protein
MHAQDPDKVALLEQIGEPWKTLIDQAAAIAPPLVISVKSGGVDWTPARAGTPDLACHALRGGSAAFVSLDGGRMYMQALHLDGASSKRADSASNGPRQGFRLTCGCCPAHQTAWQGFFAAVPRRVCTVRSRVNTPLVRSHLSPRSSP